MYMYGKYYKGVAINKKENFNSIDESYSEKQLFYLSTSSISISHRIRDEIIRIGHFQKVPGGNGNNDYAKFWRDKQRVLWYF